MVSEKYLLPSLVYSIRPRLQLPGAQSSEPLMRTHAKKKKKKKTARGNAQKAFVLLAAPKSEQDFPISRYAIVNRDGQLLHNIISIIALILPYYVTAMGSLWAIRHFDFWRSPDRNK